MEITPSCLFPLTESLLAPGPPLPPSPPSKALRRNTVYTGASPPSHPPPSPPTTAFGLLQPPQSNPRARPSGPVPELSAAPELRIICCLLPETCSLLGLPWCYKTQAPPPSLPHFPWPSPKGSLSFCPRGTSPSGWQMVIIHSLEFPIALEFP